MYSGSWDRITLDPFRASRQDNIFSMFRLLYPSKTLFKKSSDIFIQISWTILPALRSYFSEAGFILSILSAHIACGFKRCRLGQKTPPSFLQPSPPEIMIHSIVDCCIMFSYQSDFHRKGKKSEVKNHNTRKTKQVFTGFLCIRVDFCP